MTHRYQIKEIYLSTFLKFYRFGILSFLALYTTYNNRLIKPKFVFFLRHPVITGMYCYVWLSLLSLIEFYLQLSILWNFALQMWFRRQSLYSCRHFSKFTQKFFYYHRHTSQAWFWRLYKIGLIQDQCLSQPSSDKHPSASERLIERNYSKWDTSEYSALSGIFTLNPLPQMSTKGGDRKCKNQRGRRIPMKQGPVDWQHPLTCRLTETKETHRVFTVHQMWF